MTVFTKFHSDLFYLRLASVAIGGPILLVIAAGRLPEGLVKGELIVYGHGIVLAILATAVVLRAAYAVGFSRAWKIATAAPGHSVTA
ncbi:MAG: hypothetical protein ACHQIL_11435 [Steroidobacterales bacterium]